MAGDTMRFRNPAGHAGLLHNLLAVVNDLAGFLESRIGLFAKESKTALVQILVLVACIVAAAVFALFGYVFLLAFIALMIARSRMKKSMFEVTALELKKDREWLKNLDKKNRSTN